MLLQTRFLSEMLWETQIALTNTRFYGWRNIYKDDAEPFAGAARRLRFRSAVAVHVRDRRLLASRSLDIYVMKAEVMVGFVWLVFCSGCGTVVSRTGIHTLSDKPQPRYYPATCWSSRMIAAPAHPEDGSSGGRAAWCLAGSIDLPISLTTDTLLLPYDIFKKPE